MARGFRLGRWIVWPRRDRIDGQGKTIHIKPKSMAVLEYLARADGHVVPRNDILDAVWPGADVTDDVLTQSVTELRKAFGDNAQDSRIIETIPKKGLRLIPEAEWFDESAQSGDNAALPSSGVSAQIRVGHLLTLIVIVGVLVSIYVFLPFRDDPLAGPPVTKAIAVLPFADTSPDEDQEYLADSLATELTSRLARVDGLLVYGPRLADLFNAATDEAPAIDYKLDGSVSRIDNNLRITVMLSESGAGPQVWSHSFDRTYEDWFDIQNEIASLVADALSVELGVGDIALRLGGTSNIAAFEQVRMGDSLYDFTPENMPQALAHYSHATRLDPEYAIAWERVAMYYNEAWFTEGWTAIKRYSDLADAAIHKAITLAPNSEQVLLTAADIQMMRYNYSAAREIFDHVEELYPEPVRNLLGPRFWYAADWHMFSRPGHMQKLIARLEAARRVDALPLKIATILPHAYLSAGAFADAEDEIDRVAVADTRYHLANLRVLVALSMQDKRRIRDSLQYVAETGSPPDQAMLERLFDREQALTWLREAFAADPDLDYYVSVWASYYRDDALALAAMQRARDPWTFWLPLTAHLRVTDEFKTLVREMGLVDYWREYGWNDYCEPVGDDDFVCS